MTEREMLIELLAIKLYEHDSVTGVWPPKLGWKRWPSWRARKEVARQRYRDKINEAKSPGELYLPAHLVAQIG